MQVRLVVAVVLAVFSGEAIALAQPLTSAPSAATKPAPTPWTWHPSLFALASSDVNSDPPVGSPSPVNFDEPEFAENLGGGMEGGLTSGRTRIDMDLFGLARSPVSGSARAMYVGGRLNWSWQPSRTWNINVRDNAKLQRQVNLDVAGFERNDAAVGVEWRHPTAPLGISLEVGDRRRDLPALEVLGFARQSYTLSAVSSNTTSAGEVGISVQPYRASTAAGRRLVLSAELARFGNGWTGSARYAFVEPWSDRSTPFNGEPGEGAGEFSSIARADFLEQLSLEGRDSTIASEAFALDPVETDSDDWDFGRRKHVAVGFLSRRFAHESVLSGSIRYQRRDGPNLLAPEGSALSEPFRDTRLALRVTFRRPVSNRLTLVAQASDLRNRSDRAAIDFSRRLIGVGLQIRFGSHSN